MKTCLSAFNLDISKNLHETKPPSFNKKEEKNQYIAMDMTAPTIFETPALDPLLFSVLHFERNKKWTFYSAQQPER